MSTGSLTPPYQGLLYVNDAAQRLGVTRVTLYRMIGEGLIARVKHGRRTWIHEDAIADYFARKRAEGEKHAASLRKATRTSKAS